jgi:hypothetical protein
MQESLESIKKEIQKELDAYKADNSTAKSYFLSMKEISQWLKEEKK